MELHRVQPHHLKDCEFWLQGFCKYEEGNCRQGRHDQNKLGTKRRRTRSHSPGGSPPKRHNNGGDFMEEYKRQQAFLDQVMEDRRRMSAMMDPGQPQRSSQDLNPDMVNQLRDLLGYQNPRLPPMTSSMMGSMAPGYKPSGFTSPRYYGGRR